MNAKPVRKPKKQKTIVEVPVGAMSPAELEATLQEVFGGRGRQSSFARGTGLSPSTITRYLQGTFPVPCYIGVIVEMLLTLRRNGLPVPDRFSLEHAPKD